MTKSRGILFRSTKTHPQERFMDHVEFDPNGGCWLWSGAVNSDGYGNFAFGRDRIVRAHRFSWRAFRSDISRRTHVLHRCDVRACVNPDHLFLGDHPTNMADMAAKGRARVIQSPNRFLPEGELRRVLGGRVSARSLAATYGTSSATVRRHAESLAAGKPKVRYGTVRIGPNRFAVEDRLTGERAGDMLQHWARKEAGERNARSLVARLREEAK